MYPEEDHARVRRNQSLCEADGLSAISPWQEQEEQEGEVGRGEIHHPGHFLSGGFTPLILAHQNTRYICTIMFYKGAASPNIICVFRLSQTIAVSTEEKGMILDCSSKPLGNCTNLALCA